MAVAVGVPPPLLLLAPQSKRLAAGGQGAVHAPLNLLGRRVTCWVLLPQLQLVVEAGTMAWVVPCVLLVAAAVVGVPVPGGVGVQAWG